MLAVLGVMLIVVAATPVKNRLLDMASSHPRMSTNYLSIEILKDYPVKGIGFGMKIYGNHPLLSPERYMSRIPPEYRQYEFFHVPHNMLLSVAVRTGLVGLGLFLYIMIAFAFMCWKLIVKGKDDFIREWSRCILSAFVLLFAAGLFEPVFNHLTETILFTVFGMGTVLWRIDQEGRQALPKTP
jgi:O-antigen ligase